MVVYLHTGVMRPRVDEGSIIRLPKEVKNHIYKIRKIGSMLSVFQIIYYKRMVVLTMNEKLMKYLEVVFSPYEDSLVLKELKEEMSNDLQEKLSDLKNQSYDGEAVYNMTIDSIGDISEIIESISAKERELQQMVRQGKFYQIQSLFCTVSIFKVIMSKCIRHDYLFLGLEKLFVQNVQQNNN